MFNNVVGLSIDVSCSSVSPTWFMYSCPLDVLIEGLESGFILIPEAVQSACVMFRKWLPAFGHACGTHLGIIIAVPLWYGVVGVTWGLFVEVYIKFTTW